MHFLYFWTKWPKSYRNSKIHVFTEESHTASYRPKRNPWPCSNTPIMLTLVPLPKHQGPTKMHLPGLVPIRLCCRPQVCEVEAIACCKLVVGIHDQVTNDLSWVMQWCSYDNSIRSMAGNPFLGCTSALIWSSCRILAFLYENTKKGILVILIKRGTCWQFYLKIGKI